ALAVAGRAHGDFRLHLAVELVEIGRALQQLQRAHADEIALQRVNGTDRRGIDGEIDIGLAAIGAEIGDAQLQHAAGEVRFDRGRSELRVAEIELRSGNARLDVDVVEAVEVNGRVAPRRLRRRRRAFRHRDVEPMEIEVELDLRLARDIDRG